ncbi:hypothetical protein [Streptomyces sp. bgisy126]|uniref:hypothetical protein n=1 Tax=unclassified Streptomyces TaxID=2593676 RepID=UPI003EB829EF
MASPPVITGRVWVRGRLAAQRMGHAPDTMSYFDDEPAFVTAARSIGLDAHLFTGPIYFTRTLVRAGLPLAART